jgi:hypothetical protein
MTINVTIVTTANRTRRFVQNDENAIQDLFGTLRLSGQIFTHRTLIIGSERETEIFSPAAITRIEIATGRDLSAILPQLGDTQLTLIPAGAATPAPEVSDTHVAGRIDFFFEGGDSIGIWFSGPRPNNENERLMRLTRLFEQPVLMYRLPDGGVGFMNPGKMTRATVAARPDKLPAGSWLLNPVS